jgi:SagB-type dehydrogenase family enzyme
MKNIITVLAAALFLYCTVSYAEELKPVQLLQPQMESGKPLMQALKDRKSVRSFLPKELPLQVISDLLWAANGINRLDSGKRTAPTAQNLQEIDIYVVTAEGAYLYDAKANVLAPIAAGDLRKSTGTQEFVKNAPVNLVFVADMAKMAGMLDQDAIFYAATDTGFISENVYLYCSSAGLATVVRGLIDKAELSKAMKLRPEQNIILAQTVGYPAEE